MPYRYTRNLTIGYNHVFQDGRISMPAIMEELEETASEHCRLIGQDLFSLLKQNTAWALKGGALKMTSYPSYSKNIIIETWLSSLNRYRGYREFVIRDEKGEVLGEASTLWIFMDLLKRTLMPIPEVFHKGWKTCHHRPIITEFRKKDYIPLSSGQSSTFDLRRRDFDSNGHVHNIRYLEWLTESIAPEIYENCQISQMEVLYRKEATSGNPVQIRTKNLGNKTFRHDISDSRTGTLLVSARSSWLEKAELYSASENLQGLNSA